MKKLSFFLMAMLFSVMSFAAETVAYTLTPAATGDNSSPHNAYASAADWTYEGITWNVTGNSHMVPWRIGGKSITAQDRAVYTKTAMAADITKIEITHATVNITCNSCTLTISDAANGDGETFPVKVTQNTTTTITLPEGDYSNKFYKLVYNVTNTTTSNKYVQLSEIKFYTEVQTSVEAPTFTPEEGKVAANNTFAEPFALTIASATTDATIKYTLDGTDPTLETALTYEAPITISTMVQVRAIAVKGEEKSVESSVAYIISSSEAKPYTASEAIAAEALGLTGNVYVTGTVKSIEELSTEYGNATYNITDGTKELKIYRGKNLENAKFTSADQLLVGDVVVVKGDLTSYNGAAQLGQNNYLISRITAPTTYTVTATAENGTVEGAGEYEEGKEATLTATPAEGYEFVNWTSGETEVSTANPFTFTVTSDTTLVANFKEVVVEEPVEAKLYLTPNANWLKDNARFAAYFFGNGETWVSMTKVAGETNLYEVAVPTTKVYPNVIFCRMNPSAAANNWTNKWNQTDDLVIPTDGKNHYTVKENTWDKGGGTWSVWPLPVERTYVDVTITVTANAPASIKWANAGDELADATDYVAMTAGENNTYTYTLAQVDEATGVDYTIKVGDFVSVEQNTSKNVTIDFKALLPQVAVQGVNNWDGTDKMTIADDYLTASITLPLVAKKYDLKLTVDGAWKGTTSNNITRENNSSAFTGDSGNGSITADVEGDYVFTYTYATKTLTVTYPKLPAKPEVVTEMVGIVKRAIQNGDNTIVLTHEADGTAHIYELANGTILELVQEGVVPVDPEDEYDYLAISDIATTEDGKLVATNYTRCNFGSSDYGTSYFYIWNNLDAAPTIWFKSNASSNSTYSDQGYTMAVKGTSTNAVVMTTGVHNTKRGVRMSQYTIIDGVYEDINNAGGFKTSEYYFLFGLTDNVVFNENNSGTNLELNALGENWVMDGNLIEPTEWAVPATMSENHIVQGVIAEGTLGKKYNGATYVTVGEQVLMVAPYADAEGKLAGVKILDVTAGFAAATEVATANLDAAVEATAAATAVAVAENTLTITLVADATIYTLNVELESEPEYWVIEDNITNLVIDLENMAIIGGPSTMWQVDVYLGLGQDNGDGTFTLTEESSVAIMGFDARFIDGYVYDIDANAPAAKAVLHVEDNGSFYEIKLDMTSTPQEAIVVVVEDATVQIDTIPLFGDQVDYALKMTANWTYAEDGVTYPVLVEVPVYYPEATEPSEMTCTVTIGEDDYDPWLGFGEGTLTITTVDGVVTAKGIVANPYTGVAFDVTVSGKLPAAEPVKHTVTITVNPEGAGTVTGAGEYADGAEVTVTAEENEGYIFLGWMEDGEFVAEDYEYTFTILNDVDLVAVYATQLVGVAEDLVITETALTATAILSTGTTLTVNLVLGEYDEEQGAYWLAETTTLTLGDKELTFLEGLVMVDTEQQTAIAAVLAEHEGVFYAFTLVLAAPASGVDNINTNVAPRKVIRDGQLIIIKNGVEYNVQGATLK